MEILIPAWVSCAILGTMLGARRNEPVAGFFLGLCFGPLGVLFVALHSSGKGKTCPYCREWVKSDAIICKHCHQSLGGGGVAGAG